MKEQYTVIIPTMWRSPMYLLKMAEIYNSNSFIKEIIIIDNNPERNINLSEFSKIKKITKGKNIYVNPAWNWGAKEATSEKIIIANDDIFVPDFNKLISTIDKFIKPNMVIGPSTECIKLNQISFLGRIWNKLARDGLLKLNKSFTAIGPANYYSESNNIAAISLERGVKNLTSGWGTMMWMYKKSYKVIPEELKIFYGDSFQYHSNNPYIFNGIFVETPMSHTIKTTNVSSVLKTDRELFMEKYAGKIDNKALNNLSS